ncbi:MAG TPA: type II toxin-antitoxin system VapC family toxin [Hyphomicrobiaceae bacterium]|nr:type II toxin-antitoxin system VapC family toxin [Hyphomicrobiaceae bacterium]
MSGSHKGAISERCERIAPILPSLLARIEPSLVDSALTALDEMRPVINANIQILRRAADLAISLNHHLFDTLYHAVALEEGATLVTADEAYFNKAKDRGCVQLLRDFQAP